MDWVRRRSLETEAAQAEHVAVVLASHSDHPVSRAIAAGLKPNGVSRRGTSGRGAGRVCEPRSVA